MRDKAVKWIMRAGIVACVVTSSCSDPFATEVPRAYTHVATGGEHTCALSEAGEAYCWGRGLDGELGTGTRENQMTPARVAGNLVFADITAGEAHSCGLTTAGVAHCWGDNAFLQRGNPNDARASEPLPVVTERRFMSISAGARHTCALGTDSLAYCWGWNQHGQLGDGTTENAGVPRAVTGDIKFAAVTSGTFHSCAITAAGAAYCWGTNAFGQLGVGASVNTTVPLAVAGGIRFAQIDAGMHHTCGTAFETRFYCWGSSEYGEIGDGTAYGAGQPGPGAPVPVSTNFPGGLGVFAGVSHTCAMGMDGTGRCWGRGLYGQLGNGALADNLYQQPLIIFRDVVQFTALGVGGSTHTCGIIAKTVFCWGTGPSGQLGAGPNTYSLIPQRILE
jgi:alpha-tubulin suppressor-like RCC1 family protein